MGDWRSGTGPEGRGRVILLTGPSGAGKSRLAERLRAAHGWPVVRLDDFYRELGDLRLPPLAHLRPSPCP